MSVAVARPLRGSREHNFYPVVHNPSIKTLDSAFQLQEYISYLIRENPHDIQRIVSLPKPTRQSEDLDSRDAGQEDEKDDSVDESCWIYEQLRRLAQDLNYPLITTLQLQCTRETCPEMKAGEWLYLCVAHGTSNTMEQCCAIDYILHTVDSATALLSSPRAFPSRITIPQTSYRHFSSLARRLGRIFAHAYFQHREAFEEAEAESSLYSRYLALTSTFDLVPADYLNIPARDGKPPTLESAAVEIKPPLQAQHDGSSPGRGNGRSRTDTMVFAEGFMMPPSEDDLSVYHAHQDIMHGEHERPSYHETPVSLHASYQDRHNAARQYYQTTPHEDSPFDDVHGTSSEHPLQEDHEDAIVDDHSVDPEAHSTAPLTAEAFTNTEPLSDNETDGTLHNEPASEALDQPTPLAEHVEQTGVEISMEEDIPETAKQEQLPAETSESSTETDPEEQQDDVSPPNEEREPETLPPAEPEPVEFSILEKPESPPSPPPPPQSDPEPAAVEPQPEEVPDSQSGLEPVVPQDQEQAETPSETEHEVSIPDTEEKLGPEVITVEEQPEQHPLEPVVTSPTLDADRTREEDLDAVERILDE